MVRGNTEKQIASTIRGVSSELAEDVDSLNANGGRGILVSVSPHFTQQSEVFDRLGRGFIATPARDAEFASQTEPEVAADYAKLAIS